MNATSATEFTNHVLIPVSNPCLVSLIQPETLSFPVLMPLFLTRDDPQSLLILHPTTAARFAPNFISSSSQSRLLVAPALSAVLETICALTSSKLSVTVYLPDLHLFCTKLSSWRTAIACIRHLVSSAPLVVFAAAPASAIGLSDAVVEVNVSRGRGPGWHEVTYYASGQTMALEVHPARSVFME